MSFPSAVFVYIGLILLPSALAGLADPTGSAVASPTGSLIPRKFGPFPGFSNFLCGAIGPRFGQAFAQVKCDSDLDCFKCGGGLFKCETCPSCCGGEKKCTSAAVKVRCPPPPPCAPPQPGFDPCPRPGSCTDDSQCSGTDRCKGCPSCNGEPFRGSCLPPNIVFGCRGCEQTCVSDDECPGTDKCMGCVCDGPFVGTCKRKDIFLACDCPEVRP